MQGVRPDDIRLIGVHGTATLYNDDMERAAIRRAGLESVPMCALKPFFGHTMGAAGILETILCVMQAQHDNTEPQPVRIIKMLSGFGGVNAAIMLLMEN
jgi:3-oxoacyl-(acyl-carrier-protein) synthase